MGKIGGGKNYGYGKQLAWAGKNVLKDRYGLGHFGTRAAHEGRWRVFVQFLKSQDIKDARQIKAAHIQCYARYLQQKVSVSQMRVSYAQNLLSTVNVVLSSMRKDTVLRVLPASLVGERARARTRSPQTIDRASLEVPLSHLELRGKHHVVMIVWLCREFGLRFKESCLLDVRKARRQARAHSKINITEGTKGGRGKSTDRWVPVSLFGWQVLDRALSVQGTQGNLIPRQYNYIKWRHQAYKLWYRARVKTPIGGFHDLRAAYACERYAQITGQYPWIVIGGHEGSTQSSTVSTIVDRDKDLEARRIIGLELGHNRTDVLSAYVGSIKARASS